MTQNATSRTATPQVQCSMPYPKPRFRVVRRKRRDQAWIIGLLFYQVSGKAEAAAKTWRDKGFEVLIEYVPANKEPRK